MRYLIFSLVLFLSVAAAHSQSEYDYESKVFRKYLKSTFDIRLPETDTTIFYLLPATTCGGTGSPILPHLEEIATGNRHYALLSRYFAEWNAEALKPYEANDTRVKIDYANTLDYLDIGCRNLTLVVCAGREIIEIDTRVGYILGELYYWGAEGK